MEDKNLRIEKLKAAQEKIDRKIKELEEAQLEEELDLEDEEESEKTEDDEVINIAEKKEGWKKVAAVAGIAAVAGTGVFLAVRQPWKAAKVVCHIVHIV
ncbi:hypothetical protein SAMN02910413_1185 [Pseudobutyrivibrio sp. C4]|uniref:hypothetical protein n=1 Tax=Pseudobutyrivibrio sp. C4 TaxID=1520803 RepID=UPI0008D55A1F|nr:hypothetical protein [Pseudobutyrivibrio sp. C4]SES90357.1 hypothetical protein SAMN02910413_1185 [Pseudobutyrivibrio sp. C4]